MRSAPQDPGTLVTSASAAHEPSSAPPILRLFLPFALGYFLSYLLRNVNAVIAPELSQALGVTAADLGLLTSAYLLTFGAFQLPLGILLDRYGPRRVEATLLLIAALGCVGFALGTQLTQLAVARGLIGLGVSACLMGAFKAFASWYPQERLAAMNASVMVAGGLGALSATLPLTCLLPWLGWRGLFVVLALVMVMAAAAVFSTMERRSTSAPGLHPSLPPTLPSTAPLAQQLRELLQVLRSRAFWRYAPLSAGVLGGFIALQGLWAIPWLMEVTQLSRLQAATQVLVSTIAMVLGFLSIAIGIDPARRAGISSERVLGAGTGMAVLGIALLWAGGGSLWGIWAALGFLFAVGNLSYAQLAQHFPASWAGRVNAAINVCVFMGAFLLQWGYGVILDAWVAAGGSRAEGHRVALGALLLLQSCAWCWYALASQRAQPSAQAPAVH